MRAIAERKKSPEKKLAHKNSKFGETLRRHISVDRHKNAMVQRKCACGGGCLRCRKHEKDGGIVLQTRLKISRPGERPEREAERVADATCMANSLKEEYVTLDEPGGAHH